MATTELQRQPSALNAAFLKLDKSTQDGLMADSGPPSPVLGASDPSTTVPSRGRQGGEAIKNITPSDLVTSLLASISQPATIPTLVTPDATFICPSWNQASAPSSPTSPSFNHRRHSSQAHTGPAAIAETFKAMRRHRRGLSFAIENSISQGEDVACFGKASWESEGRVCEVSFAVWAKVEGGKVGFMQLVGE